MYRIAVKPGGLIVGVYTDKIQWRRLGEISVERAAHVEYDNKQEGWTVEMADGAVLPGTWTRREDALAAEREAVSASL